MRKPRGYRNHTVAPKAWRQTSNLTGDYEMDASILHSRNKSVAAKIESHLSDGAAAYSPRTAYNGYDGYKGDN